MTLELLKRKDIWAGLMLIGIGAAAMLIARNYPFGTALRMGPGYFPTLIGGLLIVFGLVVPGLGLARRRADRRFLVAARPDYRCRCRSCCSGC